MNTVIRRCVGTMITATALTAGLAAGGGAASALPGTGDVVEYWFYSDSAAVSITYFDADNDIQNRDVRLPNFDRTEGWYTGWMKFTSRSTYQSAVATIQTNGKFAACAVRINGKSNGMKSASGRYAVASCS